MGCSHSKPESGSKRTSLSDTRNSRPTHIQPPGYDGEHTESCRILRQWEVDGGKSRSYRYVVYVSNNNLLNNQQKQGQDIILEFIQVCAAIHGLSVWVKCLDYLSGTDSDAGAEKEKQFYKEMLAKESKSDLIRLWDERDKDVLGLPNTKIEGQRPKDALFLLNLKSEEEQPKTLKSSEEEIEVVINKIRQSKALDDADAKGQIEPAIVAALSKFNKGWKLEQFLEKKTEIFGQPPDVEAEGISKLQAQFFLQARAACTSLDAIEGSVPTVAIHILPDEIPTSIFSNIQRYMNATYVPLAKLVRDGGKTVRQDRYTMQLISLGVEGKKGGYQWKNMDNAKSGGMDIVDSLHLDQRKLSEQGPGPFLGSKIFLGSTESDIDRTSKQNHPSRELYGKERCQLTKQEMVCCYCQKEPVGKEEPVGKKA